MLIGNLGSTLLGTLFSGKSRIRADEGTVTAGQNF